MQRLRCTAASFVLLLAFAGSTAGAEAVLSNASADKVHATIAVPEPSRKVGEVRLVSRGAATVVQTLISTKLLSRVVGEIHKKEEGNWPAGSADTRLYLDALDAARAKLDARDASPDWRDRRRRLLLEFVADSSNAAVLVGTFKASGEGSFEVAEREIFATLAPSRAYVLRNMRLILADSFKVAENEVDRIGPLGPASASPGSQQAEPAKEPVKTLQDPAKPSKETPKAAGAAD